FIFGVPDTYQFHKLNIIKQHRHHYSGVASLGPGFVSALQDKLGAGISFHPFININSRLIKYGVVNTYTPHRDLSRWETLYLAGPLQKPVLVLTDNPAVKEANESNLRSAIRVAMLLLPETFTERALYTTITGLSYKGDPRMDVGGDNPHKVENIVRDQLVHFRDPYSGFLRGSSGVSLL
ncbi:mitochondrial matrix Mmp37, partial [Aspergillus heteromorphus CBS 117.55]